MDFTTLNVHGKVCWESRIMTRNPHLVRNLTHTTHATSLHRYNIDESENTHFVKLTKRLTSFFDSEALLKLTNRFTYLDKSNPVKQDVGHTVILPLSK